MTYDEHEYYYREELEHERANSPFWLQFDQYLSENLPRPDQQLPAWAELPQIMKERYE